MANIEELDASTLNLGPGTYNVATLNDARAHRKTAPDIQWTKNCIFILFRFKAEVYRERCFQASGYKSNVHSKCVACVPTTNPPFFVPQHRGNAPLSKNIYSRLRRENWTIWIVYISADSMRGVAPLHCLSLRTRTCELRLELHSTFPTLCLVPVYLGVYRVYLMWLTRLLFVRHVILTTHHTTPPTASASLLCWRCGTLEHLGGCTTFGGTKKTKRRTGTYFAMPVIAVVCEYKHPSVPANPTTPTTATTATFNT